jgi:hypothetical protein
LELDNLRFETYIFTKIPIFEAIKKANIKFLIGDKVTGIVTKEIIMLEIDVKMRSLFSSYLSIRYGIIVITQINL